MIAVLLLAFLSDTVSVAIISGIVAVLVAAIPVLMSQRRTRRKVESLHDEVRTNHGQKASWYLEKIADVALEVDLSAARQERMLKLLEQHTEDDKVRFDKLEHALTSIQTTTDAAAVLSAVDRTA